VWEKWKLLSFLLSQIKFRKKFQKEKDVLSSSVSKKKHEERMEELCWRMTWGNQAEKQPFVAVFRLFF